MRKWWTLLALVIVTILAERILNDTAEKLDTPTPLSRLKFAGSYQLTDSGFLQIKFKSIGDGTVIIKSVEINRGAPNCEFLGFSGQVVDTFKRIEKYRSRHPDGKFNPSDQLDPEDVHSLPMSLEFGESYVILINPLICDWAEIRLTTDLGIWMASPKE